MSKQTPVNPFEARDAEIAQCFSALPPMVQETIQQCGVSFSTADELKTYAENLMRRS